MTRPAAELLSTAESRARRAQTRATRARAHAAQAREHALADALDGQDRDERLHRHEAELHERAAERHEEAAVLQRLHASRLRR